MIGLSLSEKYRPKTFEEIYGQEENIKIVKSVLDSKRTENFLFWGPPGTGKTSTAFVMAKYKDYEFSDFNASDDRGIDFIRDTIKQMSRTYAMGGASKKIIFLDEADMLTEPAQQGLRRIIEDYGNNNMFVFSVNDPTKIVDAILSRCVVLKFDKISKESMLKIAQNVIQTEGIKIDDEKLNKIIVNSKGSARNLINAIVMYATGGTVIENGMSVDIDNYLKFVKEGEYFKALKVIKYDNFVKVAEQLVEYFGEQKKYDEIVKIGDWVLPNPQLDSELGKKSLTAYLLKRDLN